MVTVTDVESETRALASRPVVEVPLGRVPVGWQRVRRPLTYACFAMSFLAAVATSLGSLVAGQLAERPTSLLIGLLALCVVVGAVIDTVAKTIWATVVDRAEGRLRSD